ncbi:SDR family oxidoreductase [Lewinella sp. W8]|uniref:SDR family oxidoreductase n=1 Tax=Lewinella sp. W8 TaxID=2528208 RepID=UPI00106846DB|nr:SDR family oxidoreductase [Lewinella sp. W8]MTB53176.1 NAD-dependent epimerase/dehydratase family protein [Lewinella sp. W8]
MKILVTGGAGFIGSNLVAFLLRQPEVELVRVLDNLSTGSRENVEEFLAHEKYEFLEGDIRKFEVCLEACRGIDRIAHQAALGSVPRSLENPMMTNEVNVGGTVNIFYAAKASGIDRVVYAASSSTYGDSTELPKVEDRIGKPLSPYAVTKLVNEQYAEVFNMAYGTDFIGLRYFNVFGPRQSPRGAYAAVIPIFFSLALRGQSPTINGDGSFSRDFTFIENVVQANYLALTTKNKAALNEVYNVAFGARTTLNELWEGIQEVTGTTVGATYGPERKGDIPHSHADISKAKSLLGYAPTVDIREGLRKSLEWYKNL